MFYKNKDQDTTEIGPKRLWLGGGVEFATSATKDRLQQPEVMFAVYSGIKPSAVSVWFKPKSVWIHEMFLSCRPTDPNSSVGIFSPYHFRPPKRRRDWSETKELAASFYEEDISKTCGTHVADKSFVPKRFELASYFYRSHNCDEIRDLDTTVDYGLDQLEDIYHKARENLKPFLTAPESVESFREEEMFPLSDRLYAEYYTISKYLRRAVSAVDSKPFTTSEPGIRNPTSFDLPIGSIPKLANLDSTIFQNLTTNERWDKVKDLKLCSNCLSPHLKSRCKSKHTCSFCHKPHHSLLHRPSPTASHSAFPDTTASNLTSHGPPETLKSSAAPLKVPSGPAVLSTSLQPSSVLLATALVKLYTSKTNFIIVRAVLDSASQASFVSEAAVNSLKIKRDHSAIPISGIGLSDSQSSGLSHVSVASLSGAVVSTNHPFLVLPVITRVASSLPPSPEFTAALKNVVLADPSFNSAAPIDCLLGASIFSTILTRAPRSLGPSLPYAVPTLFGDVLMGPAPLTPLSCNVACVSLLASAEHNPDLRNAPAYPVESHDPGPATLLSRSGDRDSVDHSPDSQDPPIKMLHRSLEVEKTPPTKVLQLPLGSASEEFSLKPNEQTSKPPDELLETAPESPGIPLITTPESYSLNSISSWPRWFRVVATILARRSRNRSKPHSTRSCVWHAEIAVCQHIQQSRFAPQLNQTQAGKPLSKSWVRLSPFISDDGLIRAGGPLCFHSPSCPILHPNDHPLVLALTDYLYVFFSQAGPFLFYFNLSSLWIFSARRLIKSRLHNCVTSYRAKSINHPHLLGDLPSSRVTAYPSLNSHFRVASGPGWHRTESFDKDRYGHISKPSLSSQP
ncbi:hypothetical protein AAG570_009052 [Ranatra chinensis]|uniref:Uncharacterized protein n=1 Tax=Ranatra chinensis TaxID=642074 RepID=A0ABD0YSQ8_9HEMI